MNQIRLILIFLLSSNFTIGSAQDLTKEQISLVLEKTKEHSIIGLGEAEHFYKGYYRSKVQLVKHLVEKQAFDVIALEASMNVTSLLDDYINGISTIDLPGLLSSLNEPYALQEAGLYDCAEIADMIYWLKTYNERHPNKVRLVGIDFQNYSIPLHKLKSYASADLYDRIDDAKALLDSSMTAILDSSLMIITTPGWINRFQRAKSNVKHLKTVLGNGENSDLFVELEQFTSLWDDPTFPRDSIMYENLSRHIDGKSRIVVWAANFHLENDPQFRGPKKLGVFLKDQYPKEYFIIGVTDESNERKEKVVHPVAQDGLGRYDLIINVHKESRCERLISTKENCIL